MKNQERPEDSLGLLAQIHEEIKEALEAKNGAAAMKLLEQCQSIALEMGNREEAMKGKNCEMTAILEDYCELVYEINEQIWYGEHINPGKVYRYLNKSFGLMKEGRIKGKQGQNSLISVTQHKRRRH